LPNPCLEEEEEEAATENGKPDCFCKSQECYWLLKYNSVKLYRFFVKNASNSNEMIEQRKL